jgi:SOS response regulatory protein OraA/RecX
MPQLQKLKLGPNGQTCYLTFNNGRLYRLPIDYVVSHHLKENQDFSLISYRRLVRASLYYQLYNAALRQLAIAPKTEFLLRQRLRLYAQKHRFQAPLTIVKVLHKVTRLGLIKDEAYVEHYLRKYPHKGLSLQKMELAARGVNRLLLDRLLRPSPLQAQSSIAVLLAKKKVTAELLKDLKQKNRIYSMILRKGFTLGEAKSAIDAYLKTR